MKYKKIVLVFVSALIAAISIGHPAASAYEDTQPHLTAFDTVAGFETMIKAAGELRAGTSVEFAVESPERIIRRYSAVVDADRKAQVAVKEGDVRVAGLYTVRLENYPNLTTTFTVFPADMSEDASQIFVANASRVKVRIADDFGNPLAHHIVRLTSNRSEDVIMAINGETDEEGNAHFAITAKKSGSAQLRATDESIGVTLRRAAYIIFGGDANTRFSAVGGDSVLLAQAAAGAAIARFEIDVLPATVTTNERVSFRVTALDSNGGVVSSYRGTVLFSSSDPNAQIPTPYAFQPSDQGRKTFDLGASFRAVGTQKLTVQEQGNALLKGEKTVEVRSSAAGGSTGEVRITKPATGTYSVNTLEVAGEARPNARVKIFDNGQQIAEVQANTTGRFTHTTSLLADGQHRFQAESNGVQSAEVQVSIDSTPAQAENVEIAETTLAPGATTRITVRSDPDLSAIQATVGEFITDLERDPANPSVYRGVLTAPANDGEYTVNVIITDRVGNPSPQKEAGKLRVDSSLKHDGSSSFSVPSKVTGLQAIQGSGGVTLLWTAAQAEAGIAFYRIYYGTVVNNLSVIVNTPDAQTSMPIVNLQNGVTYHFAVAGVDTQGNESDLRSDTVSAAPSAAAAPVVARTAGAAGGQQAGTAGASGTGANGIAGGGVPVLCDPSPCPPDVGYAPATPQDGPEVIGLVIASLMGAGMLRIMRKRL